MFYRIINMVCCLFDNDLLGRRTAIESSDSGRQEFFYDECSNLVRENNSVLRQNNKQIVYKYDGLNRLVYIDYPDTKDTVYTYGEKNDTKGAAGRIRKIEDASGTLEYEYGSLGDVKKETRTLTHHLNDLLEKETAVMSYRSDYLGRMQWIEYPDGERIVYGYDKGGQVISVTGSHWGRKFKYVTDIQYDQYGQRKRIDYGNGTFTEYNYDAKRRWLDTIKTYKADNSGNPLKTYQNITYNFDAVGNVNWYENNCIDSVRGNYKTRQEYTYDNLYQLIKVEGKSTYNPDIGNIPEYVSEYSQTFTFDDDGFGKIMNKKSTESIVPYRKIGDNLKYEFDYEYDVENYTHRRIRAGNLFYKYDDNGNIICEQDGSFDSNDDDGTYHKIQEESDEVYSTDYGWGLFRDDGTDIKGRHIRYKRMYSWNEKNMLVFSEDASHSTSYIYGQDGQRTNKYTRSSETLYFNNMWTLHTDAGNNDYGGQYAKNVYLGETRIVTKLYLKNDPRVDAEEVQQYFYHSDHLGSASLISDYKGDEYQRIEYTPYGETWIERTDNKGVDYLPYRFTGKELDEETGLYYYGARYLDPKYSTWISTDPALGDYIPQAPINDEARRHNQNLPGMGGIFNHINNNLYHYAGNNPVKYTDPDGKYLINNTIVFNNYGQSVTAETYALSHFDEIRKTAKYAFRLGWWKNTETKSFDLLPLPAANSGFTNNVAFADAGTMNIIKSIAASQKKHDKIISEFVFAKVTTEKKENGIIAVNLTVSRITATYESNIIDITSPITVTLAFTTGEELNSFQTRKEGLEVIAKTALKYAGIELKFGVEE